MKHKILIIPLISFLVLGSGIAQEYVNIAPDWLINSSGENWDVACDMVAGSDSSLFLAGNFSGTSKIKDKTTSLSGDNNSFILKLDEEGNQLWQTHLASSGFCNIVSLSIDSDGSVYGCGTFKGSLNVGSASISDSVNKNLFILKLDKKGEVVMLQQICGKFSNQHIAITNNSKNELLLAASFKGNLLIDDLYFTSNYYFDILIAKIDPNGKVLEKDILHGEMDDMVNGIVCDKSDNIYITGSLEHDLTFGNNILKTKDDTDAFLIKLTDSFGYVYGKQIGGIYDDYGKSIAITNNNNLLLAGSFAGEMTLSGGYELTSNGVLDVFVIEYDKNGNLVWAESFGGKANDYVSSMTLSPKGNIYIDGSYRGLIEKDDFKIKSTDFSNDIFLAKYNATGQFRFLETAGDTNVDFGRKLISDKNGYIYLSGDFTKSLKLLDKETKEAVDKDFFIARLYDCEETPKVQLPSDTTLCGDELKLTANPGFEKYFWYDWQGTKEYTIDTTGMYILKAIDKHGCLSEDTIFVELYPIPDFDFGDTIFASKYEIITLYGPTDIKTYLWSDNSSLNYLEIDSKDLNYGLYSYALQVEDKNGCYAIDNVTLIVDKTADISGFKSDNFQSTPVQVYTFPNPVEDVLYISIVDKYKIGEVKFELISSNGKIVWQIEKDISNNSIRIEKSMRDFQTGVYVLTIIGGSFNERIHVIVK